jgi:prophage regulatory protein
MDLQRSGPSPGTILRLAEVLRKTGLSRSTLYNRIAKREFPHQVSLGGRAIGWLSGEVEGWINERALLRPESAVKSPDPATEATSAIRGLTQCKERGTQRSAESTSYVVSLNGGSPDPAQLHLVGTKLYFNGSTGDFWIKLLPEISSERRKRSNLSRS